MRVQEGYCEFGLYSVKISTKSEAISIEKDICKTRRRPIIYMPLGAGWSHLHEFLAPFLVQTFVFVFLL